MSRPRFIPAVLAAGLLIGFGALAPQAHADDGPFVHAVMAADAPTFISGGNATWTATLTNVGTVDIAGLTSAALVMTDCAITQADGTT
ncbi:MAG: hypothetical protein FWC46_01355, partial [Actinomycetia bacterium]|nr:hypothetical protein [Actinomycetes bacterium]